MKLKLIDQKEMPLLQRKIINLELTYEHSSTPKKEDVSKELVPFLKTKESLLKIKKINTHYGEGKADITAFIYSNEDSLKRFEKQKVKKVKEKKEEKKESGKEESKEQEKQ